MCGLDPGGWVWADWGRETILDHDTGARVGRGMDTILVSADAGGQDWG